MPLLVKIQCGLAFLGLMFASSAANAEERLYVTLEYSADAAVSGCPDEAEFRALVSDQLDYDPFRAESDYRVVARAEQTAGGIRGSVRWYDATGADRGERELRAHEDCAALAKDMGFSIAVQVQLLATERASAREGSGESAHTDPSSSVVPAAAEPADPAPDRPKAPPAVDEERGGIEFLLGVGAGAGIGLTPRAIGEGRVFAAARKSVVAFEAAAEASLKGQRDTGQGEGFSGRFMLGSVAGCVSLSAFFGCVVQKLGVLEVEGFGIDLPRTPTGLIAQSGVRLGAGVELGPHAHAALRVELLSTLTRWEVQLNRNDVWRVPPVGLTVGADVAALFR